VQQLILAARAFGVGTSLTMLYAGYEDELRGLLGLPDDALTMGLLPLGYPHKAAGRSPNAGPWKKSCTGTDGEPPAAAADHPLRSRRREIGMAGVLACAWRCDVNPHLDDLAAR
jgi:hypothetical protein